MEIFSLRPWRTPTSLSSLRGPQWTKCQAASCVHTCSCVPHYRLALCVCLGVPFVLGFIEPASHVHSRRHPFHILLSQNGSVAEAIQGESLVVCVGYLLIFFKKEKGASQQQTKGFPNGCSGGDTFAKALSQPSGSIRKSKQ